MEIQDLPAIAEVAHDRGVLVGCDNTWATPLLFKPLARGADIVIEAITKYVGGHSDLLMGSITVNDPNLHKRIKSTNGLLGLGVSPEDCYLALRGLETMAVRLAHSGSVALDLAKWLTRSPIVTTVLHPALPSCPGHEIWKRDFSGSSGVFTVVFAPEYQQALYQSWDQLRFFALGASWGGTKSLAVPMDLKGARTVTTPPSGLLVRISVGLEDPDDLRSDLELLSSPSAIQEGSKEFRILG
jgi:cystathionine beta-lyase